MATAAISPSGRQAVVQSYRTLVGLVRRMPEQDKRQNALNQLRSKFRQHATAPESEVPALLKEAEKRAAFLRMITPRPRLTSAQVEDNGGGSTRYVYRKDGRVEINARGTSILDKNGRKVHTNWDGKNMDPCSVKRHFQDLKRMGFQNNSHAKGMF
jgi:hypothetical protein